MVVVTPIGIPKLELWDEKKDAGAGVVGGAIGGTIVFGFPIGTIGGAIFGLAGGLVTGAAKESFGVNQYVDDTVTKVDDYILIVVVVNQEDINRSYK